jgi:hypothetical protein
MIYIKNGNSFDKLSDWAELTRRVSFQSVVDLKGKKLLDAFGYYEFPVKRSCGLKGCRKQHYKGVLVITEDGIETNIGHDCGFSFFGVKFEQLATELTNQANYHRSLVILKEAKDATWNYLNEAAKLEVGKSNLVWAAHHILDLKDPEVIGRAAYTHLTQMASTGNGRITISRRKTDAESDIDDVMKSNSSTDIHESDDSAKKTKKPKYENVVIGTVQHVDSLLNDNNLAIIFERDIKLVLGQLQECDPDTINKRKLVSLSIKVARLKERFAFVEDRLKKAKILLTQENLAPLYAKISTQRTVSQKDKNLFREFIESLPETAS